MSVELRATDLSFSYESTSQHTPLFSINLEQKGSGTHVLMGESGSGKSTLLKTLSGVLKPSKGKILLGGHDLWPPKSDLVNSKILKKIGFCFQNNALFSSMSCMENLCFAHRKRHPQTDEKTRQNLAYDWLEQVELKDQAQRYPRELSGGMQKRLAIARTLILNPTYIFFDDPTAGLDPINSRSIAKLLTNLLTQKETLTWIVTNDLERACFWSNEIYFLESSTLNKRVIR